MKATKVSRILFVCLGNICRSPTAEAVFSQMLDQQGVAASVMVDSCGIGDWHTGNPPDSRATAAAAKKGYDLRMLRARQLQPEDFDDNDYILAMDGSNLDALQVLCPDTYQGHLGLFLDFAGLGTPRDVPDPFYGGTAGFDKVLNLIEAASQGLLQVLVHEGTKNVEAAAQ